MLIDATHPEETRVAVVNGNRLEEYDCETISRKQIKGNIYLVKVTRVEPSLQAAFVDFGGNRHGFLPFPEIHPDYYKIPVADKQAILEEERRLAREAAEAEDLEEAKFEEASIEEGDVEAGNIDEEAADFEVGSTEDTTVEKIEVEEAPIQLIEDDAIEVEAAEEIESEVKEECPKAIASQKLKETLVEYEVYERDDEDDETEYHIQEEDGETEVLDKDIEVEDMEEEGAGAEIQRKKPSQKLKKYKIQEVIKRNQIMLVQIGKEERGNKGAAVTSYISLPGRYCVLMPNSPRGGGVSRKVSNIKDRQRLKKYLKNMDVPEGMSVILRTAAILRSEAEIRRDLEYLLRLWNQIRELTLKSTAPAMIYEEGNLIKRSIRDLYKHDIEEVHIAGAKAFKTAQDFTKTLAPSGMDKLKQYKDDFIPLFFRYQVENQIDEIHSTTVHLKSGGYIVINPTEALVSIDVNSGKATKGHHIEETAVKTNVEAAEEIARQLRLRDQGGLVVIDFIDMEEQRNNRIVERKLKEAMQNDRARIQMGRMSPFGLLELSRQRLNPSLVETNFEVCEHCEGRGVVRTLETTAVIVLRAIEEEGLRQRADEVHVSLPTDIAIYLLNHKRKALKKIEDKYEIKAFLNSDDTLIKPNFEIKTVQNKRENNKKRRPIRTVDMSDFVIEEPVEETNTSNKGATESKSNVTELVDENQDKVTRPNQRPSTRRRGKRGGKNRGRSRNNNKNTRYNNKNKNGNDNKEKVAPKKEEPRKGWWRRILSD